MVFGTGLIGRTMDWRYQAELKEFRKRLIQKGELEKRLEAEGVKDVDKLQDFPLERVCFFFQFILPQCSLIFTCRLVLNICLN